MKIGIIYQGVYPPIKGASGSDRRVRAITRGLSQRNEVVMLVPSDKNFGQLIPDEGEYTVDYMGKYNEGKHSLLNKWHFWKGVLKQSLLEKFDVILFYNTSIESVYVAKKLRKKRCFIAYEICDEPSSSLSGWQKWRTSYPEKNLPKLSHFNIVISRYLKEKVLSIAPSTPALTIPILSDQEKFTPNKSMVDKDRKSLGLNPEDIVFSYVGGTWKEEGVASLLYSLSSIKDQFNNVKVVIAGKLKNTKRHDNVKGIINDLKLHDFVITPGWVDTDKVIAIYNASDVLCLPQIQHKFNVAGLPTKLAEYSSMGKAILATNVGDVGEYFTDNETIALYEPGDDEKMIATMTALIEDSSLRHRLGLGALTVAQNNFDYKNAGEAISEHLNLLVNRKNNLS